MNTPRRRLISITSLTLLYVVAGKLGLSLAFVHPNATLIWANSGIALAALLILGSEVWPAVLIGAFLVNITTEASFATSTGIAVGNTLEALVGWHLVRKYANGRAAMKRTPDIFKFTLFAGLLSTAISASIGAGSLWAGGSATRESLGNLWLTWWLGDAVGVLVIAPVFLTWTSGKRRWKWSRFRPSAVTLLVSLTLTSQIVFNSFLLPGKGYALEYVCLPFLAWAAFRFGRREASIATLLLAANAIWGTLSGFGPFGQQSLRESLLLLDVFLGVSSVMTLVLAAEIAERRRAETAARALAVSDPLTGLGNHRKLIESLEHEIRRCERTKRSFAFLLLDLDYLKKINDHYGHLAGDRALCRLANVLTRLGRAGDTIVRYGGDEFAMLLVETDREGAWRVGERIQAGLASDHEDPPLSVSVGVAFWPDDGPTFQQLIQNADKTLYAMKRIGPRTDISYSSGK